MLRNALRCTIAWLCAGTALGASGVQGQVLPERWRSQVELGFNGSSGNTSFSILTVGGSVTLATTALPRQELQFAIHYKEDQHSSFRCTNLDE